MFSHGLGCKLGGIASHKLFKSFFDFSTSDEATGKQGSADSWSHDVGRNRKMDKTEMHINSVSYFLRPDFCWLLLFLEVVFTLEEPALTAGFVRRAAAAALKAVAAP